MRKRNMKRTFRFKTRAKKTERRPLIPWQATALGVGVAVASLFIGAMLFAAVFKAFAMKDGAIEPINQILRAMSVVVGARFCVKRSPERGILLAVAVGGILTVLTHVAYMAVVRQTAPFSVWLTDAALACAAGAVAGFLFAPKKQEKTR